jgi:hypothetical protein
MGRALKSGSIAVAFDAFQNPQAPGVGVRVVVRTQKPQALTTILVDELVEGLLEGFLRHPSSVPARD